MNAPSASKCPWSSLTFSGLILAFVITPASAVQERVFRPGMELGRGVNILSGDVRGVCVTRGEAGKPSGGQESELKIEKIESKDQLRKSMGLDAQASLTGLGSAKASYLNSRDINQYSLYLLVKASVRNSQQLMDTDKVAIHPDAVRLLQAKQAKRFRERCGDRFVNGLLTGGEFFAIYEISTSSREERKKVEIEAEASYGVFGGSVEFKKAMDRISSIANTKIYVYRNGDNGAPLPATPAEILAYAPAFPSVIAKTENAVGYEVLLLDYATLNLPNDGESPLVTSLFEGEIEVLATLDSEYDDATHSLLYVLENEDEFEALTAEKKQQLTDELVRLQETRKLIRLKAIACFNRDQDACMKPFQPSIEVPALSAILPQQRVTSIEDAASPAEETLPVAVANKLQNACDKQVVPRNKDVAIVKVTRVNKGIQVVYRGKPGTSLKVLREATKPAKTDAGESVKFWTIPKASNVVRTELKRQCYVLTDLDIDARRSYCYQVKDRASKNSQRGDGKCLSI